MKKQDLVKLRDQSQAELETQVEKLTKELTQLRLEFATGKLKNVKAVGRKRRDIAQVRTILREKEFKAVHSGD